MYKLRSLLLGLSFLAGIGIAAPPAMAGTVIATLNAFGSGDTITLHAVRPNGTPFGVQVLNGMSTFTRTGGTEASQLVGSGGNSFFAFCVEPYEDAQLNASYAYTMSPLTSAANSSILGGIGADRADDIAVLFGQFAPNLAAPMTPVQTSALQVALWEIVSELSSNPFNVNSGNTYFTTPASSSFTNVMDLAQNYLTYVGSANGSAPRAQGLQALTINGNQDFLAQVASTAPEPGTWLMMLIGFGLVGSAMRSDRRRTVRVDASPRLPRNGQSPFAA